MRLRAVAVRNFRCYKEETVLEVDDFTTIIGANDSGKSSFLDALAIFFGEAKPDDKDACVDGDKADMAIICTFDDLPTSILIDATHTTSLADEYLLNPDGHLEIHQIFNGALKVPKAATKIRASHPSAEHASDLLSLKRAALKTRCRDLGVPLEGVNQNVNAELRAAIRAHVGDLNLEVQDIEVDLDGAKELFPKIKEQMPAFFLFQSDRPSTDQDAEAQNPMKAAVRIALEQQAEQLSHIAEAVREQVQDLAGKALEKITEMAPEVAAELSPSISEPKWDSIFKLGLDSDIEIPLNKRGSGVRRLVLLGFLQAQIENSRLESPDRGVIYAIEEPETSQHPDKQRALLDAFRSLSDDYGYQVLMTTHTPNLARLMPSECLRFVERGEDGTRTLHRGDVDDTKELIRKTLGVHPDHDVRLFLGVEGINDENFLMNLSEILAATDDAIRPLAELVAEGRVILIPLGGSSLAHWVARLKQLRCKELYIFDRDIEPPADPSYKEQADLFNAQDGCEAVHTSKRELENYLHKDAINSAIDEANIEPVEDFDDVPAVVAEAIYEANKDEDACSWEDLEERKQEKRVSRAKRRLNTAAASQMTESLLTQSDSNGDVTRWLRKITSIAMEASGPET